MTDRILLFLKNKDCISRTQLENDLDISIRWAQRIIKQLLLKNYIAFDHIKQVKYDTSRKSVKIYQINHFMINQSPKTELDYYNNMIKERAAAVELIRSKNIADTAKIAAAVSASSTSTAYSTAYNSTPGISTDYNTGSINQVLSTSGSHRSSSINNDIRMGSVPHSQRWLEARKYEAQLKSQHKIAVELDYRNACGSRFEEKKTALDMFYD
jgi:hypothetical protein